MDTFEDGAPRRVQLNLRLTEAQDEMIRRAAARDHLNVGVWVRQAALRQAELSEPRSVAQRVDEAEEIARAIEEGAKKPRAALTNDSDDELPPGYRSVDK